MKNEFQTMKVFDPFNGTEEERMFNHKDSRQRDVGKTLM
jgi:hypothetical protein